MTTSFGRRMRGWPLAAGLAAGLAIAAGCQPEEHVPTSAPPSPLPTADSSRPVPPKPPRTDQGGETQKVGSVDRDLSKDLASPIIEPGGPTSGFSPARKPDAPGYNGDEKSGQP